MHRNLSNFGQGEMLAAAQYWAQNLVIMPLCDPWRVHLFATCFAALVAPKADDLEAWLRHAHASVAGASLVTSCYQQARLELLSQHPPWSRASEIAVPGMPTIATHGQGWSREMRLNEMQRLLDEIKSDGQLAVAPSGTLFAR